MMSGVSSRSMRVSSQVVRSRPDASVKSLRHARSSEPHPGIGEKGKDLTFERQGVDGEG
jgi:hypothetical protein